MRFLVLLALGTLAYLYFSGQLTARLWRLIGAGALGLVALRLLLMGRLPVGIALAGAAAALALWDRRPRKRRAIDLDEARAILGLDAHADAAAIQAAHRRLIAQVHPDKGGSAELARRVNAARDVLLDALNHTPPRAS